ncbi:hypothetical protein AB0C33_43620 [Nonomuraea sp. NPDC048881]|uniref:hypothetical protein n=1 Tax=Nonomuraea sp. NPDC048881 TaxID=3155030 RepID=UPI0033D0DC07
MLGVSDHALPGGAMFPPQHRATCPQAEHALDLLASAKQKGKPAMKHLLRLAATTVATAAIGALVGAVAPAQAHTAQAAAQGAFSFTGARGTPSPKDITLHWRGTCERAAGFQRSTSRGSSRPSLTGAPIVLMAGTTVRIIRLESLEKPSRKTSLRSKWAVIRRSSRTKVGLVIHG